MISGPYSSGIVEDGLDHLLQNPEFQLRSTLLEPRLLKQQTDELRHITLQLKSAHTGLDVEWWNEVNKSLFSFLCLFKVFFKFLLGRVQNTLFTVEKIRAKTEKSATRLVNSVNSNYVHTY